MRTQKLPGLSKASGTLTFSLFFLHYDLIYGVSEAEKRDSINICLVNYYLVYGTSETAKSKWIEDHYGELPLDLRCLRNYSRIKGEDVIGELLLSLWYLRN